MDSRSRCAPYSDFHRIPCRRVLIRTTVTADPGGGWWMSWATFLDLYSSGRAGDPLANGGWLQGLGGGTGWSGGATVEVGCRHLAGRFAFVGNHCAIRVSAQGRSQVRELLDQRGVNRIAVWNGGAPDASHYGWVPVNISDAAAIAAFNDWAAQVDGQAYSFYGDSNSNRFVFVVIALAGGTVPRSAVPRSGFTPGICGGLGLSTGHGCSP